MFGTLESFGAATRLFASVVDEVPESAWDNPSPCEDWSARQIASHVAWRIDRIGRFAAGLGANDRADEFTMLGDKPAIDFHRINERALDRLDQPGSLDRIATTRVGIMPVREVLEWNWHEPVLHAWDLGTATGVDHGIDDTLASQVYVNLFNTAETLRAGNLMAPPTEPRSELGMLGLLLSLTGRRPPVHDGNDDRLMSLLPALTNNREILAQTLAHFQAVLDRVPADSWDAATCCHGWDVTDVATHVMWRFRRIGDYAAGLPATSAQDWPRFEGDVAARCAQVIDQVYDDLSRPGATRRVLASEVGSMTVEQSLGLMWIEVLLHTWDIADGADVDHGITDDMAELAFRQFHKVRDHIARTRLLAEPVPAEGDTMLDTLIGFAGRRSVRGATTDVPVAAAAGSSLSNV